MNDLLDVKSHFAFGENWRSFANIIDAERIQASDDGIRRLFQPGELAEKSVIDIGCGSGLPALSILRLGAAHVTCVDIDPNSVAAATKTLSQYAPREAWDAQVKSVFDLSGQFDVVYSWGVLHHTGDMPGAMKRAAGLVKPGGLLVIALYAKTPLCGFWRLFKRLYSGSPTAVQKVAQGLYMMIYSVASAVAGNGSQQVRARGMNNAHDVHDWLGGYPYESASLRDVKRMLPDMEVVRFSARYNPKTFGVLGSGCDEYVLRHKIKAAA